jgi:hypothetical protein
MTIDELIAEIVSGGFEKYDEAGQVDRISLRTWIRNELKRFGGNLTTRNETILHVKDNRTKLPENFWQLFLAVNCEIEAFEKDDPNNILQNSFFFKERTEGIMEWDNMNESYVNKTYNYVREDFYFHDAKASFYYKNPTLLRLGKGFNKSVCNSECPNLRPYLVSNDLNEINKVGDYLNANFREGMIYMQYDGLACDEDGNILIPETQHNRLREYLIYYCRMRIIEDLMHEEPSIANMLNYYSGRVNETFGLAMTEVKFEALGKGWKQKVRNRMRAQTLKYDYMLPTK